MTTFYILHYSNDNGSKEAVVITESEPTTDFIEESKPFGMTFSKAIECETKSFNFDTLPLDYQLDRHNL